MFLLSPSTAIQWKMPVKILRSSWFAQVWDPSWISSVSKGEAKQTISRPLHHFKTNLIMSRDISDVQYLCWAFFCSLRADAKTYPSFPGPFQLGFFCDSIILMGFFRYRSPNWSRLDWHAWISFTFSLLSCQAEYCNVWMCHRSLNFKLSLKVGKTFK